MNNVKHHLKKNNKRYHLLRSLIKTVLVIGLAVAASLAIQGGDKLSAQGGNTLVDQGGNTLVAQGGNTLVDQGGNTLI